MPSDITELYERLAAEWGVHVEEVARRVSENLHAPVRQWGRGLQTNTRELRACSRPASDSAR